MTIVLLSVLLATVASVHCQQQWQSADSPSRVIVKTLFVPLYKNGGAGTVPVKLGRTEERQIISELNQFLLKQQQDHPQRGYYNIQIRANQNPVANNHQAHTNTINLPPRPEIVNLPQPVLQSQPTQSVPAPQSEYSSHQIYKQPVYSQDSSMQSHLHSTQSHLRSHNAEQNRNYASNLLLPASQSQHNEGFHENIKTVRDYQTPFQPDVSTRYHSGPTQDNVEYHHNVPSTSNAPPYISTNGPVMQYQQPKQDYQFEEPAHNPIQPPVSAPAGVSHQLPITSSSQRQAGQQLQTNHHVPSAQPPQTFHSYQIALSHQVQQNHPESSHHTAVQHAYPQQSQSSQTSAPTSTFNSASTVQYEPLPPQQSNNVPSHQISSSNIPHTHHHQQQQQSTQSQQHTYISYAPRNVNQPLTSSQYHAESQVSSYQPSAVTSYHQQPVQMIGQQNHQNKVYQESIPVLQSSDDSSQNYNTPTESSQETYNADPRLVYASPPSNYLYSETQQQKQQQQQQYTTSSNPQNIVVVYKNQPNAYIQQPQNYNQQPQNYNQQRSHQDYTAEEQSENTLPKVNFKPVYGYSYN